MLRELAAGTQMLEVAAADPFGEDKVVHNLVFVAKTGL